MKKMSEQILMLRAIKSIKEMKRLRPNYKNHYLNTLLEVRNYPNKGYRVWNSCNEYYAAGISKTIYPNMGKTMRYKYFERQLEAMENE